MSRSRSRVPIFACLAIVLLLPIASTPAGAELREVEIGFEPELPTWRDPVTVTVEGESDCAVVLHDFSTGFVGGTGYVLRIEIEESCSPGLPTFASFEESLELGRLPSQNYTVHLTPPDEPETVLAETELSVLLPADAEIVLPEEPPTDGAPFTFTVSAFDSSCVTPFLEDVVGNVILVNYPLYCPVLPPGPEILDAEIEVGPLAPGDYEIRVLRRDFERPDHVARRTVHVYDDDFCVPSDEALCLDGERFRVTVEWMDFDGETGEGRAVPLREDTGLFWFFDEENIELTVKVLDGCATNDRYWVFIASGSNVAYDVTVTDTQTDESRTYGNDLGVLSELLGDVDAFTCP